MTVIERANKARWEIHLAAPDDVADDIDSIITDLLAEVEKLEIRCDELCTDNITKTKLAVKYKDTRTSAKYWQTQWLEAKADIERLSALAEGNRVAWQEALIEVERLEKENELLKQQDKAIDAKWNELQAELSRYQELATKQADEIGELKHTLLQYLSAVEVEGAIEYDAVSEEYYVSADVDYDGPLALQCYNNRYGPVRVRVLVLGEEK